MDLVQIQHPYDMLLSCSSLGNNIQSSWRSRFIEHIHGNRSVKYSTVSLTSTETSGWCVWWSVNLRWWAVLAHVSPRDHFQPLQHTDTWYFSYVYWNEVTGIVHASLGMLPVGIHWVLSCYNVIFPSASSWVIYYHLCACWRHVWDYFNVGQGV